MSDKRLMFIYSNEIETMEDAIQWSKGINTKEQLYVVKQHSEYTHNDIFLVVRYPRENEEIKATYRGEYAEEELTAIGKDGE